MTRKIADSAGRFVAMAALTIFVLAAGATRAAAQSVWEPVGPWGGSQSVVFLTSKGTLLCSNADGGVFRSQDAGQSWGMVRATKTDAHGLVDVGFCTFAEGPEGLYAGGPRGLWFSDDDGQRWERLKLKHEALGAEAGGPVIVSIVVLDPRHLALGCAPAPGGKAAEFDGVYEVRSGKEWAVTEYKFRGTRSQDKEKPIVRLAFDADFQGGQTLFAISYRSGLCVYETAGQKRWQSKTVKLPEDITGRLTAVCVDPVQDALYVGTSECEFGRGVPAGKDWQWEFFSPMDTGAKKDADAKKDAGAKKDTDAKKDSGAKKDGGAGAKGEAAAKGAAKPVAPPPAPEPRPVVHAIALDPFKAGRVWWGTAVEGGLYRAQPAKTFYGWAEWRGKWTGFGGWDGPGISIAPDSRIGSTPDRENQRYAARVFVAQPGGTSVLATNDGGQTWKALNSGIGGVKVDRICCHQVDKRPALAVAGAESSGLSWDGGRAWEKRLSFGAEVDRTGRCWGLFGIPARYRTGSLNKAELLAVWGLPSTRPADDGLFAVWGAGDAAEPVRSRRLLGEPAAGIFADPLNDRYAFLTLQAGGVAAYDFSEQRVVRVEKGLPGEGARCTDDMMSREASGTLAMCFGRNQDWTAAFVSATQARVAADDLYALRGRGGLYRALPLYEGWKLKTDVAWERIDPQARDEDTKSGVFVTLACQGSCMVAFSTTGELYATEDAFARTVEWRTHRVRAGVEAEPLFTGMAVVWESGEVFVSTFGGGVFKLALKDALGAAEEVRAQPFGRGLGTLRIRSLAVGADGQWLFAGGEAMGVWRCALRPATGDAGR